MPKTSHRILGPQTPSRADRIGAGIGVVLAILWFLIRFAFFLGIIALAAWTLSASLPTLGFWSAYGIVAVALFVVAGGTSAARRKK